MKKIKVGFDYDDTIRERRSIQLYCVELLKDPLIEPHIVTRRANRIDRVNWPYVEPIYWLEVYDLAKKLGIHYDHVHFCNFEMKDTFYKTRLGYDFLWHLDDCGHDCLLLENTTKVKAINHLFYPDWMRRCDDLIKEAKQKII